MKVPDALRQLNDETSHDHGPSEAKVSIHTDFNTIQKINFVVPRCSVCKHEMEFSEGDVIFGDKWYHSSCWKEIQSLVEMVS